MARRPGSGKIPRQARDTSSPGAEAKTPGIALPADLGRSLRLLDDTQIDRLAGAVADEVRRRGRSVPDRHTGVGRSPKRTAAKAARAKLHRAATVTRGQERLIPAAFDAGLRPAAIAKEFREEFRVSRSAV